MIVTVLFICRRSPERGRLGGRTRRAVANAKADSGRALPFQNGEFRKLKKGSHSLASVVLLTEEAALCFPR